MISRVILSLVLCTAIYVIAVISLIPAVGCNCHNVDRIALKDVLDLSVICAGALSDVNGSCCIYGYIKLGFCDLLLSRNGKRSKGNCSAEH